MKPMNLFRFCASSSSLSWDTGFGFDCNTASVRCIKQTKNIEQRTFAASRRADHRVNASGLDLERHTAQSVHAFLFFAEVTLDPSQLRHVSALISILEW
jgi:hypothetical protein